MLLQVAAQIHGIKLRAESEIVLDDHGLHVRVQHRADDPIFEAGHGDHFVYKGIFRAAELPHFGAALADLFRSRIVADNQHLEIGFGEVAGFEIILHQAVTALPLRLLTHLPGIGRTAVGTGDDCLGDAGGKSRETGIITPGEGVLQGTHEQLAWIGVEGFDITEGLQQRFGLCGQFRGGTPGRTPGDKGLAGVGQILPAVTTGFAGAEHAGGITGWFLVRFGG